MEKKNLAISDDSISDDSISSGDEKKSEIRWEIKVNNDPMQPIPPSVHPVTVPSLGKKYLSSIEDTSSSEDEVGEISPKVMQGMIAGPFSLLLKPTNRQEEVRCLLPSKLQTISDSHKQIKNYRASPSSESSKSDHHDRITNSVVSAPKPTPHYSHPHTDTSINTNSDSDDCESEIAASIKPNPLQQLLLPQRETIPTQSKYLPAGSSKDERSLKIQTSNALNNWRRSLWPPLSPFYRILLRCKCVRIEQNGSSTGSGFTSKKLRSETSNSSSSIQVPPLTAAEISDAPYIGLEWTDFWDTSCLERIPTTFESAAEHNRIFYLQLLEECRSWMCTLPSLSPDSRDQDEVTRASSHQGMSNKRRPTQNSWFSVTIKMMSHYVETNSKLELTDVGSSDPRLGSLLILNVSVLPSGLSTEDSMPPYRSGSCDSWNEFCPDLRPGDLVAIKSGHLGERIGLGVVLIWNPDSALCPSVQQLSDQASTTDERQMLRIVVCICKADICQSDNGKKGQKRSWCSDINEAISYMNTYGGWLQEGDICQGSILDLMVISNTVTASRECQALSSLSAMPLKLKEIILTPSEDMSYPRISEGSLTRVRDRDPIACPVGVPLPLWSALQQNYNSSQMRAISSICLHNGDKQGSNLMQSNFPFLLLQGPPGTGKTHTILGIISALLVVGVPTETSKRSGQRVTIGGSLSTPSSNSFVPPTQKTRILLCAPSNTAIDEIVTRLLSQGVLDQNGTRKNNLRIVRVGQINDFKSGDSDIRGVQDVTLDYLVEKRRQFFLVTCLNSSRRDLENAQRGTFQGRDGKGFLPRMPGTIALRQIILEEADIVCCTLSGAGSPQLLECVMNTSAETSSSSNKSQAINFDVIIVDEAAQAVEPSTIIPFKYNPKMVILVGDPKQLCAVVQSSNTMKCGYGRSLFERLNQGGYPMLMLETQYRMHPDISYFPSYEFYQGRLLNDPRMNFTQARNQVIKGSHWRPYHNDSSRKYGPLVWHDFYSGQQEIVGTSYRNQHEAHYILNLITNFRQLYPDHCLGGIGIIAAYKAQQRYLKKIFRERFGNIFSKRSDSFYLEISTVDGFQGKEMDIIIFSCVRTISSSSNASSSIGIGFMADWQRLNVAITRAKYALWIVGDIKKLEDGGEVWRHLIDHCQRRRLVLLTESSKQLPKNDFK